MAEVLMVRGTGIRLTDLTGVEISGTWRRWDGLDTEWETVHSPAVAKSVACIVEYEKANVYMVLKHLCILYT